MSAEMVTHVRSMLTAQRREAYLESVGKPGKRRLQPGAAPERDAEFWLYKIIDGVYLEEATKAVVRYGDQPGACLEGDWLRWLAVAQTLLFWARDSDAAQPLRDAAWALQRMAALAETYHAQHPIAEGA
jgi:hypothetical protein